EADGLLGCLRPRVRLRRDDLWKFVSGRECGCSGRDDGRVPRARRGAAGVPGSLVRDGFAVLRGAGRDALRDVLPDDLHHVLRGAVVVHAGGVGERKNSTLRMVASARLLGRSCRPRGRLAILCTTSMPETTYPNTE